MIQITKKVKDFDVVLYSCVTLVRNISNFKFVHILNSEEKKKVLNNIKRNLPNSSYKIECACDLNDEFVNYFTSSDTLKNSKSYVIISDDKNFCGRINQKEHLELNYFCFGSDISNCYIMIENIVSEFEKNISFAKNDKYGYLTSSLENIGTGMNIECILHMPALSKSNKFDKIVEQVNDIGFCIETVKTCQNCKNLGLYKVCNKKTLGITKKDILYNMRALISNLVSYERAERETIDNKNIVLKDSVCRAYGILNNARCISCKEALELLLKLRIGICLNIINNISLEKIQELIVNIKKIKFDKVLNNELIYENEDIKRAEYLREELK